MRRSLLIRLVACAAVCGLLGFSVAQAAEFLRRYRVRRLSDPLTLASPPFTPADDAPDCELFPGVPEIIGDGFDPGAFDQIDLAGNGRMVAYASAATPTSIGVRAIVVLKEGGGDEVVAEAAGDDDQPQIAFDALGWRMAFRGSDGAAGDSGSNIYLHTVTRVAGDATEGDPVPAPTTDVSTRNLTDLDTAEGLFARDPALAARTRTRSFGSGVTARERDARIAFVSNGDLDKGLLPRSDPGEGKNPDNVEQVFVWRERERRFEQVTRNDDLFVTMARPTISGNGRFIAFESDGDLAPDAVNPRDPDDVGNPDGVRQIFLWADNPKGARLLQLTWSDEDCFAPRMTNKGRFVFFCSRGDILPGGNPEGNFEIFRWRRRAKPERALAQLTQTTAGHSVLPRAMRSARRFVFYSTAAPPVGQLRFGDGDPQCGPTALLWSRGNVRLISGLLDVENAALVLNGEQPVLVGPPAAVTVTKVHFATNDPALDPPEQPDDPNGLLFHMARATRFAR